MRCLLLVPVLLLLAGLAIPVYAADENRIGYVSFNQVSIQLRNEMAVVEVDYTVDPGMNLIIILFGAGDLQKKVERSLNFPSLKAGAVGPSHAVFTVFGISENYGDQAYWFPPHTFGVTFPRVEMKAPGYILSFTKAHAIPKGFGYFGEMP